VTRLKVPDATEDKLYATRSGVEEQAAQTIAARYKTACGAPIIQDPQLHQDFGFLANTKAAERVLVGTYEYPEGMDAHTCILLEEAHSAFSSLSEEEVVDFATTTDFQSFWQHADEDIRSLESGCHFGHYKAVSHDWYISALHCAKLMLAATTGIPLACWGCGLTVLLEKVFGNIYNDKMRAVCLLEADYNWLNKYVFAKMNDGQGFL
jgi:hypothetical protein